MYVSGYNNPIVDALLEKLDDKSDDAPARQIEERVAATFKKAADEAYDGLLDTVRNYLLDNMQDSIRDAATRMAGSIVESAIAGDVETFKSFFQWQFEWKHPAHYGFDGESLPLGADLRRKVLMLHRDLFESKVLSDMEAELVALRAESARWKAAYARAVGADEEAAQPAR